MKTDYSAFKHVAIIMDGNRRWAKENGLSTGEGHAEGGERLEDIVESCVKFGIKFLTVYALSTENLKSRSKLELSILFKLFEKIIREKIDRLNENGVRVKFVGRINELPTNLQRLAQTTQERLKDNHKLILNIALNYGGRAEIIDAVKKFNKDVSKIEENDINDNLYTSDSPDPDLIIRTGGEQRLSNFLLWQSSYSELYFTQILWPDFKEREFAGVLEEVSKRRRRFGH